LLQEKVWIDTEEGRMCCKMIAVHAGLEKSRGVDEQLVFLRARDMSIPKVEDLSGRANVWEIPEVMQQFYFAVLSLGINICEFSVLYLKRHHNISRLSNQTLVI